MEQALRKLEEESEKLWHAAIELKLKMTVEERIEAHENARNLFLDLQKTGENLRAKSKVTP